MESKMVDLDIVQIQKYLRNRYPFLMLDHVDEVIPGKSARGYKNVSYNEWYFRGHFPDDPMVPGALQLESIFNLAGLAIHTLSGNEAALSTIARVKNACFFKQVRPGERMNISIEIESWKRGCGSGKGEIQVNDSVVCKAEYTIVLPSAMPDIKRNTREA